MNLEDEIISLGQRQEADYIGFADLNSARDEILKQGGEFVRSYPTAVAFGLVLPGSIVDMLGAPDNRVGKIQYRHHAYNVINNRLDLLGSMIAGIIQKNGFSAFPIPASVRVDDDRLCSIFSHKLAARQAGFGWIGKSCMLITPDHGPRVRWGSVLTDAPLPAVSSPMEEKCGSCHACIDICPVQAFTGEPFREGEPREIRYAAEKCDQFFRDLTKRNEDSVCGLCLYVCPYGRKKPFRFTK